MTWKTREVESKALKADISIWSFDNTRWKDTRNSAHVYIQAWYDIRSQIEILGSFLITPLNPSFETCIAWFAFISIASLQ
jgi:hypothetical protein